MNITQNNSVIPIGNVKPNDYNPKPDYNETEELKTEYEKIKKSLKVHGQIDPILVRETDKELEIINGFHRWVAMKELGFKEIEIKNLGKISREDAIAKALSTENLKIPLDVIEIAKLVKDLKEMGTDLNKLPYSLEEIDAKIDMLDFDSDKLKEGETKDLPRIETLDIIVTSGQKEIIMSAVNKVREKEKVKEGRALELISADYLAGH